MQSSLCYAVIATALAAPSACGVTGDAHLDATVSPADNGSLAAPQLSAHGQALRDSLDALLRAHVTRGFSGVVLVERDGEVVLHEAYGSERSGITRRTAFWIGSVSKPFTAIAVLQLVGQQRLSLEDSIGALFEGVPADKRGITVHQLLTHTSGLGHRYAADGIVDRRAAVEAILGTPLTGLPGARFVYSNDGYTLLAALVEERSGMPYEQYVHDRLFAPSKMRESGLWGEPGGAERAVLAPVGRAPTRANARMNWGFRGASGVSSTAGDLYRWRLALDASALLPRRLNELMYEPHAVRSEQDAYGYGWQLVTTPGERTAGHSGAESGLDHYAMYMRGVDRQFTIIFLSNAPAGLSRDVRRSVHRTVISSTTAQ